MTRSDNYALMREWLVSSYGGASRIINDTVMALGKRKKPVPTDRSERYLHVSAILAALQRLEKLVCSHSWIQIEGMFVFSKYSNIFEQVTDIPRL